jgi:ABC transporter DrrB family efflux protein
LFLLIFRYVFGGAIQTGRVAYVDYLIPAMAAGTGLFASGAVGVAEDIESGLFDRLRSLPIPRSTTLLGRSLADTVLVAWGTLITVVLGFAVGFRFHAGVPSALAALALCVVFGAAFTWPFIYMGLVSGSAQAAQGMSFMAFPFVFVSSAYVPVHSMPGWMQPVAAHQPFTVMVGAVRSLTLGGRAQALLGHSTAWFVLWSLVWAAAIIAVFATLAARRFARS